MGSAGTVDVDIRANAQSISGEVMKQLAVVSSQMAKTMAAVGTKVD